MNLRSSSVAVIFAETCLVLVVAWIAARLIGIRLPTMGSGSPVIVRVSPNPDEAGVPPGAQVSVLFDKQIAGNTATDGSFTLRDERRNVVPAHVRYESATRRAILLPDSPLSAGTTYRATITGGESGITDKRKRPLNGTHTWTFTIGMMRHQTPVEGPGGPILIVTSRQNGFSEYYAEILRAEGLNEFSVCEATQLSRELLSRYAVLLLGEVPLSTPQSRLIESFVRNGGSLITMRPEAGLARALGLTTAPPAQLKDGYISIDPQTPYGAGLVHEPIQFHGTGSLYRMRYGTTIATYYESGEKALPYPAVATIRIGRGIAAVFAYDLARSVIYTRQGNPAWSGRERDGRPPMRADDLFYGGAQHAETDWVDPKKIAIPQADIQQRLLANLILGLSSAKMPLPRFWYLPRGAKAAIVMTGDDHDGGGTFNRFQSYLAKSPPHCAPQNWECLHATAYIFNGTLPPARLKILADQGFEVALHVSSDCEDWGARSGKHADGNGLKHAMNAIYTRQLAAFAATDPALPRPETVRTHCIAWGDYDTQPQVEARHGIRLDTNYYYWPPEWVRNRPGLFTGSGMPMRFATLNGAPIDVYQAATQMTDESQQAYPFTVDALLANALGPREYYGVFTANLHNDRRYSAAADAVIASALEHHVPVVSAVEMLRWLDGRNNSAFRDLQWTNGALSFNVDVAVGGNGLQTMLPLTVEAGRLDSLTRDGVQVRRERRSFAGVDYAMFPAGPGRFVATYRRSGL